MFGVNLRLISFGGYARPQPASSQPWGIIYLTIILRGRAGYEMIYITNEARSAELVMIISYPASPSTIIVLLKTPTSQLFYVEFIWSFFLGAAKLCICCCVH